MRDGPRRAAETWRNDISQVVVLNLASDMVERLAQHRHCRSCEKAIPYKDEYCDGKCEEDWKAKMRKKKNQLTYFYVIMVVVMILAIALTMMG